MLAVFDYTEASLTDTFGQPQSIDKDADNGLASIEYEYGDMEFKLAVFEEGTEASVYEAELKSDKVPAPREIKIGDTMEEVVAKFPQTSDETIQEGTDTYQMLYGEFDLPGRGNLVALKLCLINRGLGALDVYKRQLYRLLRQRGR